MATAASIAVPGAVFQCQLPATVQDAISVVQKMRPETSWANVLVSSGSDQLKPGDALAAQTYSVASYDSFGYASIGIPKTERRGITLPQLERIGSFIEDHAHFWIETYSGSPNFGEALEAQSLNLHHASYWLISPATRQFMCSFVELVAKEAEEQRPWWFVSHAWQEAVLRFVACLRRHASLRNATQSAYWVCAYANNQHKLEEEICLNPRSTSFYRAMMQCVGVVLILDKDATPFTRIWCCFEESIAVEECNAGSPLLLDVAATDSSNEAHVLTDGLAAAELQQMPLIGFLAKSVREAAFPTALAEKGLSINIAEANASKAEDKTFKAQAIAAPE